MIPPAPLNKFTTFAFLREYCGPLPNPYTRDQVVLMQFSSKERFLQTLADWEKLSYGRWRYKRVMAVRVRPKRQLIIRPYLEGGADYTQFSFMPGAAAPRR